MFKEKLLEIFPKGDTYNYWILEVSSYKDTVSIKWGKMYNAPTFNLGMLFPLCEFLGTTNIKIDGENYGGCDTCDYGSEYSHIFKINDITKNKDEFLKFCEENKGDNLYEI